MNTSDRQLQILSSLCNLPTAPFREQHVQAWLKKWAADHELPLTQDGAGNLYVEYLRGPKSETPLLIEAHMDHPGFMAVGNDAGGIVRAEFRGGVKPSYFTNQTARFFIEDAASTQQTQPFYVPRGRWIEGQVLEVKSRSDIRVMDVLLKSGEEIPPGTLGMWNLPDVKIEGDLFHARVCDDLGGVAATVCLLEQLRSMQIDAHVIGMFDRAEEVGFAGVIAACQNKWVPQNARIIGLETSSGPTLLGQGPIIRVGDRTALYSTSFIYFLTQTAGFISDDDSTFKYQRKLMDGGTCNSTAFAAWEFDSAGMCVALGNYHNMAPAPDGKIAQEFISLSDYRGLIRILIEAVRRYPKYIAGFAPMRERFLKIHAAEHIPWLYPNPPAPPPS